jgi:peptide-methionine (R)-S-oxide reductase
MDVKISKRAFLGGVSMAAVAGAFAMAGCGSEARAETYPVNLTPAQWRRRLSSQQFAVLREAATERAGSSPLNDEHRPGTFVCAGCNLAVFRSQDKFDSGTGWPSFTRAIPGHVGTETDTSLFMARTAVHCRRCGGHLGHVFDDGPPPTHQRWCMNGIAMRFVPAAHGRA